MMSEIGRTVQYLDQVHTERCMHPERDRYGGAAVPHWMYICTCIPTCTFFNSQPIALETCLPPS